ncbi:hypothetical protein DSO57_1001059 [Entomophthora muscae]|uniref:Uncharacterized protein n=1 Tax=Entomophthora muscae TaxID=34485 RepID=A0ACC2RP10_9FUNG|nr:hypothetical protein DSO57_1001059 [Entomophthora muscae]
MYSNPSSPPKGNGGITNCMIFLGDSEPELTPLTLVSINAQLLWGEITPDARSWRSLASAVSSMMQDLYATAQLPPSAICPSFTNYYSHQFVHPAIHHLLQLVATHHTEVLCHLEQFFQLHSFILQLQQETSIFKNENQNTVIDLRSTMEIVHSRLQIVDSGLDSFTC